MGNRFTGRLVAINTKPLDGDAFMESIQASITGPFADAVHWTLGRSPRQQPALTVMAWLAAFGSIMRGYRTDTDLRSNLMIAGVAPSGAGKDSARKAVAKAFTEAGAVAHLGGEAVASGTGLISAVVRQPSLLLMLDELGHVLKGLCDEKSPRHVQEIATTMTKLFTSSSSIYLGTEYADQRVRPRQPITEPCVSIYGTATHEQFYSNLRGAKVDDGTFSRWIIFDAGEQVPSVVASGGPDQPVPPSLIAGIKRILARAATSEMSGMSCAAAPAGVELGFSPSAWLLVDDIREWSNLQEKVCNRFARPLVARLVEQVCKVALVHAVACDPDAEGIEIESVEFGFLVAANSIGTILLGASRFASDSEQERKTKRVAERLTGN